MKITSFTLGGALGTTAIPVSITCTVDANRLDAFKINGVSPVRAKEIAVRVRSAIAATTGLCTWPVGQVTIDVDAQGAPLKASILDLPIACAIAGVNVEGLLVAGELGLDGSSRPVPGLVQATLLAKSLGLRGVLVPIYGVRDARETIGDGLQVYALAHLVDLNGGVENLLATVLPRTKKSTAMVDFSEVRGQSGAIAAIENAVCTRSNILMSGSPGVGKTMIARRIPTVLTPMSKDEQIEVTQVYSAIGMSDGLMTERPFRAPHHTISAAALGGGGHSPRPGEAQLAMHGVLFLDEVEEFSRAAIDALASALDAMPATSRPLVVAAATPCPCGWLRSEASELLGVPQLRPCVCRPESIARHEARVKIAVEKLRVKLNMELQHVDLRALKAGPPSESSATIAARIAAC